MSKGILTIINPELLVWARQYAYFSIDEAADRLGISIEKIKSWEVGESVPTVNQLHEIAKVYHLPFAAFYLSTPPDLPPVNVRDYRRLPGDGLPNISPELVNEIRIAMNRREIFIDLMQEIGEQIQDFTLNLNAEENLERSCYLFRQQLDITFAKQNSWKDPRIAFNNWREALEKSGLLVFQSSQIPLSVARGFSLCDIPLPVIVVNRKDTYTGRIFTMFHEFSHILLRKSGVCEIEIDNSLPPEELQIEVLCNEVAAEILMPRSTFLVEFHKLKLDPSNPIIPEPIIEKFASKFGVSREAIVRRMATLGLVSEAFYQEQRAKYLKQYQERGKSSGFVHPATDVISLAGKPFSRLVITAFDNNRISSSDASNFLGIRLKHINEIGEMVGVR